MKLNGKMKVRISTDYWKTVEQSGFDFVKGEITLFHPFKMDGVQQKRYEDILRILVFLCYQTNETIHISDEELRNLYEEDDDKLRLNIESFLLNSGKETMYEYLIKVVKYKQYINEDQLSYDPEMLNKLTPGKEFYHFFIKSELLKGYRFYLTYCSADKTFINQTLQSFSIHRFECLNLYQKEFFSKADLKEESRDAIYYFEQDDPVARNRSSEIIDRITGFIKEDKTLRMKFLFL
ncbi:hypothetical protein PDK93_25345 [Bacillus cereus]|nr:hypothetical protein [Bacillus cereus]